MAVEKPHIRISVRNLVEFILRSGSLDSRMGGMDKDAMQKGGRIHRKIQKQMGSCYRAEVSLKKEIEYPDLFLRVEGRADGIQEENGSVLIDEIKGVGMDVEKMKEPVPVHRAQAMCYACIYAQEKNLPAIGVQMTYVNLDTEIIRRFQEEFSLSYLKEWFEELTASYHKWLSFQLVWRKERNASMEGMQFPFPYREGQRSIVTGVYHTISQGMQLFVQAPTGVGKTMSAVFPAVRAVGEGYGETVFYLTAKTITRTVAEEAFSILEQRGLKYKVIVITAKEKLCFQDETECNPDACPYANGHFDRINDAVYELWTTQNRYTRDILLSQAKKWKVCPFEMCLDLSIWADAVICDFNYVFDPNIHLKRFFGEGVKGDYIFLIDEAHNLVDRGREMYSAELYKEEVLELRKRLKPYGQNSLSKALKKVNSNMLAYKRECEGFQILPGCGDLLLLLANLQSELERFLEEPPDREIQREVLDFYFKIRDFLNIADLVDDNYVIYSELDENGNFKIREYCVNPAKNLKEYLDKGIGCVFFSATLLPLAYYKKLFSTEEKVYMICAHSPFPPENRRLLIAQDVTSRYTYRGYGEYQKIAAYLHCMVKAKEGNYIAFFPSYRLLEDVYEIYVKEFQEQGVRCLLQSASMTEEEREAFLEEFSGKQGTLLGFCVMGGIFSEGIDFTGEKLIGAAIIGTGLPQVSPEKEILKSFYENTGENGFDYAYRYPGMNKVLQAAGRVIRTVQDRGVILLLDNRFLASDYRKLFPIEWNGYRSCRLGTVEEELGEFWGEDKGAPSAAPPWTP